MSWPSMPNAFVSATTPATTSSGTFVDIPGMSTSLALAAASKIVAWAAISWQSLNSVVAEFRLVIDGQASDATAGTAIGVDYVSAVVITTSTAIGRGTYTIKAQWRRVSGNDVLTLGHGDITAIGLYV